MCRRLLEPVAPALKLQHHAAVHQTVQDRAGHRRIPKHIVHDQQIRLDPLPEQIRSVFAACQRIARKLCVFLLIPHDIAIMRGLVCRRLGRMALARARFAHNQRISPLGDKPQGLARSAGYLGVKAPVQIRQ